MEDVSITELSLFPDQLSETTFGPDDGFGGYQYPSGQCSDLQCTCYIYLVYSLLSFFGGFICYVSF